MPVLNLLTPFDNDYVPITRAMGFSGLDTNMRAYIERLIDFNIHYRQAWLNTNLPNPDNIPAHLTVGEYEQMNANN